MSVFFRRKRKKNNMSMSMDKYLAIKRDKKKNKYNVAPKADRTWEGRTYASKAEMEFHITQSHDPAVKYIELQVRVQLGEDFKCIMDYLITLHNDERYYVDVKGVETPRFKDVKRLWKKYGPAPLHVVKKSGRRFKTTEIIQGQH